MMRFLLCLAVVGVCATGVRAEDWPMSRYNAQRTAASPQELPTRLSLQWDREYPPTKPAWPDQAKLQVDLAYDPIVVGKRMFVGSSRYDCVTALDTETGDELWRFYMEGPIRFAPAAEHGRLYVPCDDGNLYCLEAETGKLLWQYRGGPRDRRVLGNERLISMWPTRGAPVLADGKVYFATGIWPFMGVFIHCLDATTGKEVWTNDGDGSLFIKQPHNVDAFAGVAPQGELSIAEDRLMIPGGRSVPACYDRQTGKLRYFLLGENGKHGGGCEVSIADQLMINGGEAFDLGTEKYLGPLLDLPVIGTRKWFGMRGGRLVALDGLTAEVSLEEGIDLKGMRISTPKVSSRELTSLELPSPTVLIKAGAHLYAGLKGKLLAIDVIDGVQVDEEPAETKLSVSWQADFPGTPGVLLAADDKLFAVSREGHIYCYGGREGDVRRHPIENAAAERADRWTDTAREILDQTQMRAGYCVAWGIGSGRLATELALQSQLSVIVIDDDPQRVQAFREHLQALGIDRYRVSVYNGNLLDFPLPPYLANLMVSEDLAATRVEVGTSLVKHYFHSLRPYGGIAVWLGDDALRAKIAAAGGSLNLDGWHSRETAGRLYTSRAGALPGAGNWTHEHADASNTRVSKDTLVKAPLGLLWFGGSTNEGVLPRHGHGPQPQVCDGRLFIEGTDMLRAMDIYTGRVLWQVTLPGFGAFYNNTVHQPGANASGTNYISASDGIYLAYGLQGLRLDPATGKELAEFRLPNFKGMEGHSNWGYMNVVDDLLIAGADPVFDPAQFKVVPEGTGGDDRPNDSGLSGAFSNLTTKLKSIGSDNLSSSRHLVVMDRYTGKVHWSIDAHAGFRHNATCVGGGRLYTIDRISGAELAKLKRRGETPANLARLLAYNLKTGELLWSTEADVFGTWLSYSDKNDLLVEAGRLARDTISDEPKGMRVLNARTGEVVWTNMAFGGPAMIHHDLILMAGPLSGNACDLLTGKLRMRRDPLTGEEVEWSWSRSYGCNTPVGSECLLTFRSGAAGYYDLDNDGGTGNLGGFKSGCTNNLVVAGGVLSAPDYTRTCTCNYQLQTSLALVNMPEAEMWTFTGESNPKSAIKRLGVNLGAAGDRKADNGTLWLEYPSVGGKSPNISVSVRPNTLQWFRHHSSVIVGETLPWVACSGAKGLTDLKVTLSKQAREAHNYTVRLYFSEPDEVQPGERAFDIALQGNTIMTGFDVCREAGGRYHAMVKEFKAVPISDDLNVRLTPTADAKLKAPILSGVEVIAEDDEAVSPNRANTVPRE
ncbi:MAG TPA: PQQ-binding-like beta-propeller repeat protein [Pirellulales bacterium]|nr:PQQ-binding-like beta-propeller repeat protein [Pirellulales bacterium]